MRAKINLSLINQGLPFQFGHVFAHPIRITPNVKSSKTRISSFDGVRRSSRFGKGADPTWYNVPVGGNHAPTLFDIARRMNMAIYLRGGMPVRLIEAEPRRFWRVEFPGRAEFYWKPPTPAQTKRAKEVETNWVYFAKAICLGPYPDGSGSDKVGQEVASMAEADGFINTIEMRADDGLKEIYDECRKLHPINDEIIEKLLAA